MIKINNIMRYKIFRYHEESKKYKQLILDEEYLTITEGLKGESPIKINIKLTIEEMFALSEIFKQIALRKIARQQRYNKPVYNNKYNNNHNNYQNKPQNNPKQKEKLQEWTEVITPERITPNQNN